MRGLPFVLAAVACTPAPPQPAATEVAVPSPPTLAVSAAASPASASASVSTPAPAAAPEGDFERPPYCRDFVARGAWADAHANTGEDLRVRVHALTQMANAGPGTQWRLDVDVENVAGGPIDPFLGHWDLVPLAGEGASVAGTLASPLLKGKARRLTLVFTLAPSAAPAFAFFSDDDSPLCFQVNALRAGPKRGTHPL